MSSPTIPSVVALIEDALTNMKEAKHREFYSGSAFALLVVLDSFDCDESFDLHAKLTARYIELCDV